MAIPVIDPEAEPYAVLGVSRGASADDIKRAYRQRAKSAHPDTGGSPQAMNRLNRAYDILSSPERRLEFDLARDEAADASATSARTSTRAASHSANPSAAAEPDQGVSHAVRRGQARRYVWGRIEEFGWVAALAGIALSFLATQIAGPRAWLLGFAGFIPLYWLAVQIFYVLDPDLKLVTFDAIRAPHRASPDHRRTLIIVALLWIPLGLIWAASLQLI